MRIHLLLHRWRTIVAHEGTSKRWCWENGITWWNGDGCSLIEPKLLLNNSVHQNSWGSEPPEVQPLQQRNDGVVIPINEGYPPEERCVGVENLMDEKIGQKVERAEKSCSAISHSKKKNRTDTPKRPDTPKRKYKKCSITLDDLRPLFGQKRADAAKTLGVSKSTFKRSCRENGIAWWNGEGCSLVEPKPLDNSVHQNSLGLKPPEVQGEKETLALLRAREDVVKVKAIYGEDVVNLWLSSESGVVELKEKVAERLELELGNFNVKYQDEDKDWVLIACDEDLRDCMKISSSLGNQGTRLQVIDKVSNSEKFRKSCKRLKRKRS